MSIATLAPDQDLHYATLHPALGLVLVYSDVLRMRSLVGVFIGRYPTYFADPPSDPIMVGSGKLRTDPIQLIVENQSDPIQFGSVWIGRLSNFIYCFHYESLLSSRIKTSHS